ncbi:MAG: nucleotidyltransferase family protein [Lachnospiraceae bacterium]|nr:nucleotidyltransferase family protein [Lachnospiraceae bacterium]
MKDMFSREEIELINVLRVAISNVSNQKEMSIENINSANLISMARRHAVLSLIYDVLCENQLFLDKQPYIEQETRKIVLQSYRLLFLTRYVVELLAKHHIETVVLKGVATAGFYSVPELRKSGDIDLLLPNTVDEKQITEIMKEAGFRISKNQHSNHHMVYVSAEGISIELHSMLAEPFAYKKINKAMERQMERCAVHIQKAEIMGLELPVLDKPYHAYELLLHMLQHFMYAGFGLKLLCDWVMIWKQDWLKEEREQFTMLTKECGLEKFAEMLSAVCMKYFGMPKDTFAWKVKCDENTDLLLREILDSEEFGNSDNNRMVMMNGTGLMAYIKEFHHQMRLNFQKAGKCFLLWPVLWGVTLVRFLRNNKRVRNTSTGGVLKEARRRSELMKELRIFQ